MEKENWENKLKELLPKIYNGKEWGDFSNPNKKRQ